jgi:hypothetical protein
MVFELVSHLVGAHGASMGIHGNMGAVGTHGTHGLNLVGSGNQVHDRYTTLRHPCEMRGNGGADAPVTSSGAQTLLVSQVGSIVALSACFGIGPLMQTAQKLCQKARACGAVAPHQRPVGCAIITHRKSPCCSITGPAERKEQRVSPPGAMTTVMRLAASTLLTVAVALTTAMMAFNAST